MVTLAYCLHASVFVTYPKAWAVTYARLQFRFSCIVALYFSKALVITQHILVDSTSTANNSIVGSQ